MKRSSFRRRTTSVSTPVANAPALRQLQQGHETRLNRMGRKAFLTGLMTGASWSSSLVPLPASGDVSYSAGAPLRRVSLLASGVFATTLMAGISMMPGEAMATCAVSGSTTIACGTTSTTASTTTGTNPASVLTRGYSYGAGSIVLNVTGAITTNGLAVTATGAAAHDHCQQHWLDRQQYDGTMPPSRSRAMAARLPIPATVPSRTRTQQVTPSVSLPPILARARRC